MKSRRSGHALALERLAAQGRACFDAAVVRIETDRHIDRAFSSVVRARVQTGSGPRTVWVKTFRSPDGDPTSEERLRFRVEREFRETGAAYEAFTGRPGFAPVRPLALFPDLLTIVTEEVPGEPFSILLARSARRWSAASRTGAAAGAARRIGEWLRLYQATPVELQSLGLADLREYVDVRLRRLVEESAGGFGATSRVALMKEFDSAAGAMTPADLAAVRVHADFCPENILVSGTGVSVIDFAMAKRGLRHLDVSHLLIHLGFRSGVTWSPGALADVKRTLLEGYGDPAVTASPGFRLAVLVHVAALMADRLNRASRLPGARNLWLAPQIRRCLQFVQA